MWIFIHKSAQRWHSIVQENNVVWWWRLHKLNGHVNRHNCAFYATETPHFCNEQQLNQPGVIVCGTISVDGWFLLLSRNSYWWKSQLNVSKLCFSTTSKEIWFSFANFHAKWSASTLLTESSWSVGWIGRRGSTYAPRSCDLTSLHLSVWGSVTGLYENNSRTLMRLQRLWWKNFKH